MVRAQPWVNHDRLDDEVMVIDMDTGDYFALQGAAADVWTLVAAGRTVQECVPALTARYDVDPERAHGDAAAFVGRLLERGLLDASDDSVDHTVCVPGAAGGTRAPYRTPEIDVLEDLQDLLRLDPVHEVDATGWPAARSD